MQSEDAATSIPKLTGRPPVAQASPTAGPSKNATSDDTPTPKRSSLDGIRTILRRRNAASNASSGQNTEPNANQVLQIPPRLEQPRQVSASPSSRPVDPGTFENLVDDVGAMSMEQDDDVQMQDVQDDQDALPQTLGATDVHNTTSTNSASEHLGDDITSDEEVDDLLTKHPQSDSIQPESSPSPEDEDSLDLKYPDVVEVSSL